MKLKTRVRQFLFKHDHKIAVTWLIIQTVLLLILPLLFFNKDPFDLWVSTLITSFILGFQVNQIKEYFKQRNKTRKVAETLTDIAYTELEKAGFFEDEKKDTHQR